MYRPYISLSMAMLMSSLITPTYAAIIQVTFTGNVTQVSDLTGNIFGVAAPLVGDSVTGTFTYESNSSPSDQDSSSQIGDYYNTGINWVDSIIYANGVSYTVGPYDGPYGFNSIDNDFSYNENESVYGTDPPVDYYDIGDVESYYQIDSQNILYQFNNSLYFSINEYIDEFITADSLPLGPLTWSDNDESDYGAGRYAFLDNVYNFNTSQRLRLENASFEFSVNTMNIAPIPILPPIWLFGSGMLGLVGIARRKKAV